MLKKFVVKKLFQSLLHFQKGRSEIKRKLLIKLLEVISGSLITVNVTVNNFKIEKK